MTALCPTIRTLTATIADMPFKHAARAAKKINKLGILAVLLLSFTGFTVQAQTSGTVDCVIASNDGRNGFRTDEVSSCQIDTATGESVFVFNGENRTRTYASVEPLTTQHLEAATFWLNRVGQLRFPAQSNPAGFDPREFLQAASVATHGFVLVRNKRNGGQALNVVYVTNGVYRSIDFSGTNLRAKPSGFLTTE